MAITTPTHQVLEPQRGAIGRRLLKQELIGGILLVVIVALILLLYRPAKPRQLLPLGVTLNTDTLDLGILSVANTRTASFEIANHGSTTYHVDRIVPECGCTTASIHRQTLPPGASLQIPVTVAAYSWGDGIRTKHLYLGLTDPGGRQYAITLSVTASVRRETALTLFPGHLDLFYSHEGEPLTRTLFARGDKTAIDALPSLIDIGAAPQRRLTLSLSRPAHITASRELSIALTAPRPTNDAPVTIILEVAIEGGASQQQVAVPIVLRYRPNSNHTLPPPLE